VAIRTYTWLNSYPPWLEFFPQEWQDNQSDEGFDVSRGMDYWGQFVNHRGVLHEPRARLLRRTGRMKYYPRRSECSVDALEDPLLKLFPNIRDMVRQQHS